METQVPQSYWRKCTTCKKEIGFAQKYWICSVSTCNRVRTGLVFCDLRCFDAHVPVMNHRDAGAFERRAPTQKEFLLEQEKEATAAVSPRPEGRGERRIAGASTPAIGPEGAHPGLKPEVSPSSDILVVVSKLKAYIRARSGMNTSDSVMDVLSDKIRRMADVAIKNAEKNGRKTVLDRDF